MKITSALFTTMVATVALAGCGGSGSNKTSDTALCLRNQLANQQLSSGTNCDDPTAYTAMAQSDQKINVSCTAKVGNEYVCDVTGSATQPMIAGTNAPPEIQGGFYDVTFDGKSIIYQPTQTP